MRIDVTKTYLPPIDEYIKHLSKAWKSGWITNHGALVRNLESRIKEYLRVKHVFLVNNGTIALQIAIRALDIKGEVITTPFSYVATTSSIVWERCKPVFVDIEPETLCINPGLIEKAVASKTQAILPVHVYGNPCNVESIRRIARKHQLKVIYDASHAFGVKYKGSSLLNYGDISTLSFHATKLFHTVEGGALVTDDDRLAHKISYMRNFGHNGPEAFFGLGINGKLSEFHAAMGLCILPKVKDLIRRRKAISETYDKFFKDTPLKRPEIRLNAGYNYAYYPVIFETERQLAKTKEFLNSNNIFPRRYFYPVLTDLNYVNHYNVPVAENMSKRILCLPLYYELPDKDISRISRLILRSLQS